MATQLSDHRLAYDHANTVAGALLHMASTIIGGLANIGVDVVDISDFDRIPYEANPRFYERCFSPQEIAYSRARPRPAQHFAARFAVKEAAVKAFAPVLALAYWQIEVRRDPGGQPRLMLWNHDRTTPLDGLDDIRTRVSISHSQAWAAALVVAFKDCAP